MFNTLGSFSAVYFALAAILFVLILFEKHFIQLEDKIKAKKASAKKAVKSSNYKKPALKNKQNTVKKSNRNTTTLRKIPNNAA